MKTKHFCVIGLLFFFISYLFFANILPSFHEPIDFAHWFNLIGACLLLSFNYEFPKNKLNSFASILTALGVIAHIGLCTIDFIMWSFGDNDNAKAELSYQIRNTPSLFYPFIVIGPSLLFMGLSMHALNFIKSYFILVVMVVLGSVAIGFSFFVLKDGIYMLLGCLIFVLGLGLLLYKKK